METDILVDYSSPSTPPAPRSANKRRLRILCLHGYKQNGTVFKSKTAVLRKSLDDIAEFVYVDAPHVIDETKGTSSWWRVSGDGKEYKGWEQTLDYLRNIFIKKGPFDGIMGFSQGAVLSSLLCSISSLNSDPSENGDCYRDISFQFGLLFSGFQSRATLHQSFYPCQQNHQQADAAESAANSHPNSPHYPHNKITIPSLHIWGKADELVAASNCESLSLQFSHPQCYVHEHGHLMPTSKKDIEHYRSFLLQFVDVLE
ncbi:DUF341 family protein [Heterostelium album PN500]|uniref:DUF341 family protein n=1 Tax=Heterostelium pallidum (strain ATCC 26659 / Pp 5 / PN500) TaxID=670386 RepID=D3B5P9_HETP5|nr:DUF341 family protein [Heterostelium album PN500]EFA83197.1 DUF341 family protein [Heterostelium album PN500]|eukprot:XP_020435314.1 DUF341 family protein [Heterostelium album PN500]